MGQIKFATIALDRRILLVRLNEKAFFYDDATVASNKAFCMAVLVQKVMWHVPGSLILS